MGDFFPQFGWGFGGWGEDARAEASGVLGGEVLVTLPSLCASRLQDLKIRLKLRGGVVGVGDESIVMYLGSLV
jgi:hypothetical protein